MRNTPRRRKHENLRAIVPTASTIKDKMFILPQRLNDIPRQLNHRGSSTHKLHHRFMISQ